LVENVAEQDLDDEFLDDALEFEANMQPSCQELGSQEKHQDGQSIISLSPPFPNSLVQETDFRADLFAACYDQLFHLPVVTFSPSIFDDKPVCLDLPIYDDYDDAFPEVLTIDLMSEEYSSHTNNNKL